MHDVEPGHSRFDVDCMASAIVCFVESMSRHSLAHPRIEQTMPAMLFY